MTEQWRSVVGYEGLYEVSDHGRLRSSPRQGTDGRILSVVRSKPCGYMRLRLYKGGQGAAKKVHRLVLEAFVGPCPDGHEGCHNNGERDDNHLANLRWGTRRENCADAKAHGTAAAGEKNGQSKLTWAQVQDIRRLRANGLTYQAIADRFHIANDTARSAAKGETWA